ncbi:MAG: ATP-dependent DNA ligase [Myxococcota bacterium]
MSIAPAATPTVTIDQVADLHRRLKARSGPGAAKERDRWLNELMQRCTREEQAYLVGLWTGGLRQGALESLVVDAIADAARIPVEQVRRAQMLAADIGRVAELAMTHGSEGLAAFRLELFRPVQPMLASTAEDIESVFHQVEDPWIETKIDGARVQIHKDDDEIRIFSRRLNEVTGHLPDVVKRIQALPVRRTILDGETIALRNDGTPHPFQVTMRRFGRRTSAAELPLSVFIFDCLKVDDQDLWEAPARHRLAALSERVPEDLRPLRVDHPSQADAVRFLEACLTAGHEGAMLKSGRAAYEAGRRGSHWLKLKHAHTVDLVVIAAEWGSGRRQGWLSNLHLAAPNEEGTLVMLGKTFKGLTDEALALQTRFLLEREIGRDGHVIRVRPELVVEVAFSDVQYSPHYPGGMALRFARVKRFRFDKGPESATPLQSVRAIYEGTEA